MKKTTHLQAVMAENIRLKKEAEAHAAKVTKLERFFRLPRYWTQVELEEQLLHTETQIEYILKLAYEHIPGLSSAFDDLISPLTRQGHE